MTRRVYIKGKEEQTPVKCTYDEMVSVSELKPHPKNRNKHPEAQIKRLAQILKYQGFRIPIRVSKASGFVTGGHGRIEAAKLNGWDKVPVNYQEYESEEQEYADLVADNAIALWAELDLKSIGDDITPFGPDFDINLLGLEDFTIDPSEKYDGDPDAVPETPKEAKTKRGELWLLGNHRVLCGDATDKVDVERLMNGEKADMVFTDPPYGMNLNTNHDELFKSDSSHVMKGNRFKKVEGDNKPYDPSPLLAFECQRFIWGCDYFYSKLPEGGSFVCWDKRNENLDAVPGNTAEFCWAHPPVRRTTARILWSGHHGMQNDDAKTRVHPTQKPTALAEWFFERWGKDAKIIVDLYLGSGSTLIACEKTGRKCFGMEIEPLYIQVILDRWAKFTGKDPVREDGTPWSKIKADGLE